MNEFHFAPGAPVSAVELLLRCEGLDYEELEQMILQMEAQNAMLDCSALSLPAASSCLPL